MTRSLRAKITLALLVTGLTSAVLVGVIARSILLQQFNEGVFQGSFSAFQADLTAYIATYGSWDEANRAEPFQEFVRGRRDAVPGPSRDGVGAKAARDAERTAFPDDAERPPRAAPFVAPFLFAVLDPDGRVLRAPPDTLDVGRVAPADVVARSRPIVVRGQRVAYAVPLGEPNLTEFDRTYLDAMQNAVAYGVVGAGVLALALGFFFSGRLSGNLRTLARAIQAMGEGQLRQHVTVRSRDEVQLLADAFNRMSADLSKAHHDLQASHDTIREQAARLKELSIRDETTQLHNRRYFLEQAGVAYAQAERYNRPFTVAMGDVDHFKQINDRFSHAIGDEVLRRVAALLAAGTRESDIVARYGGEEFVIAFPETSLREAGATCERIRRQIQDHDWNAVQRGLTVTMTIGVNAEVEVGSLERMVEAADARLYEGKQAGRNRVCGVPLEQPSA